MIVPAQAEAPHQRPSPLPALDTGGDAPVLLLGVGNYLMGDEGAGVQFIRGLAPGGHACPVRLLDGGTGGIHLLAEIQAHPIVVMIDATRDGRPAGTVHYLRPRLATQLPVGLSAHDFGLKDLFAAAALLGNLPELHLFTISVTSVRPMCTELSAEVAAALPAVREEVAALLATLAASGRV